MEEHFKLVTSGILASESNFQSVVCIRDISMCVFYFPVFARSLELSLMDYTLPADNVLNAVQFESVQ